jgi:hypothetical protein
VDGSFLASDQFRFMAQFSWGIIFRMLLYPFLTPGGLDSTLRYLPVIGQGVLRFAFIPAQLFPRGPCIWRKAHSEHLSSRPLIKFGGRGKDAGGVVSGD